MVAGGPARWTWKALRCWMHSVPTGMNPTDRLCGAGVEGRNGLRKEPPPCRVKPACAAARETGTSGFLGHLTESTARKKGVNQQVIDRKWSLEVGKTCSAGNLRAIRRLARLERGGRSFSRNCLDSGHDYGATSAMPAQPQSKAACQRVISASTLAMAGEPGLWRAARARSSEKTSLASGPKAGSMAFRSS